MTNEQRAILAARDRAVWSWRSDMQVSRRQSSLPESNYDKSLVAFHSVVLDGTGSYCFCGPAMTAYGT